MPPADDFSDDYGWNDELIQRRERRRKAKGKERLTVSTRRATQKGPEKTWSGGPCQNRTGTT